MNKQLGLGSLTAIVIGSMIGAGVFSLPQNMAAVASPAAVMIGWLITGVGMVFLALSFQALAAHRPKVTSGVFGYAKDGFGDFVGYCSAWGYWLSAMLANVSYLVIVFSTLGMLFDTPDNVMFGEGNTWLSVAGSSILLWLVHALVLRGVKTAAMINLITTFAKLVPLCLFIICALFAFQWQTFTFDFSGLHFGVEHGLWAQVKSTMIVTVWVFIGIEGAVVVSSRAKHRRDIGRATILGLLTALCIYVLVTLLAMGVVRPVELAEYHNPSMAQVLAEILGPWGRYIISGGLLISVCGAFLSWTVLAAEVPYSCAQEGMFPSSYANSNEAGSPVKSLLLTNVWIQISLICVVFAGSTYDSLLIIASEMILVPYFLIGAYVLKIALQEQQGGWFRFTGFAATLYGAWLLYASGLNYLLLSTILYLPGLYFFFKAKREKNLPVLVGKERMGALMLGLLALVSLILVVSGKLVVDL
ncbi:arginine:ornithine antiporter / lysine permease [Vibrio xiamenensis]|uniref:Arginine:ornithine antiporter / lysine permease n=1 Tax=Vibrio xiamenensis TaxID=861298 RepID=A0A1G7ZR77_9VIBR|nr:basic amino acid/polyamine antiporter [Vibrio xiamenensis]SDH11201.1 arginine:ornithine antiporter / lysine permease [Vibrio xiamenensis]